MSAPRSPRVQGKCGPHVELASNESAKVTRCGCGTVHVHLNTHGLSLRLGADGLRHLSNALSAASRLVDAIDAAEPPRDGAVN